MSKSPDKVRVGIIGAGGIANYHAKCYKQIPYVELVAVVDIVKEKAKDFAQRWGIPEKNVFTNHKEMLESVELDAVSICTPHAFHASISIDCLNAGVHVLVEKPMAVSGDEAYRMWKTSQKTGKILMVAFQTRYSPELIAARRIVQSGALGKIYYGETTCYGGRRRGIPGESFTRRSTAGGGVLLDLGCYSIDNAMFILGHPRPISVCAKIASVIGPQEEAVVEGGWKWNPKAFEVEDFVVAFIRFEDDLVLVLKDSWAMHANTLGTTFFLGTKGGLRLWPLEVYRDEWGYMVDLRVHELPKIDPFFRKIEEFVKAVKEGLPSPIDPKEIVVEQYIIDAIYESAREGKEVKVKLPADLIS